jgi:hypothetical protein
MTQQFHRFSVRGSAAPAFRCRLPANWRYVFATGAWLPSVQRRGSRYLWYATAIRRGVSAGGSRVFCSTRSRCRLRSQHSLALSVVYSTRNGREVSRKAATFTGQQFPFPICGLVYGLCSSDRGSFTTTYSRLCAGARKQPCDMSHVFACGVPQHQAASCSHTLDGGARLSALGNGTVHPKRDLERAHSLCPATNGGPWIQPSTKSSHRPLGERVTRTSGDCPT